MNPLMQMMGNGTGNPALQSVRNMLGMMKGVQNPQAILGTLAQQNPMMGQVLQMCRGKDPKSVFYQLCKEKGVDPQDILGQLK